MPFHVQYDKDTGDILATVLGNFTPAIKDARKQIIFDKPIDTSAKIIDIAAVTPDKQGKVLEATKDAATIFKPDPNASVPVDADPVAEDLK